MESEPVALVCCTARNGLANPQLQLMAPVLSTVSGQFVLTASSELFPRLSLHSTRNAVGGGDSCPATRAATTPPITVKVDGLLAGLDFVGLLMVIVDAIENPPVQLGFFDQRFEHDPLETRTALVHK
jgi:hypothetical protein